MEWKNFGEIGKLDNESDSRNLMNKLLSQRTCQDQSRLLMEREDDMVSGADAHFARHGIDELEGRQNVPTKFETEYYELLEAVMNRGLEVEVGEWQSQSVRDDPTMISRELLHVTVGMPIPATKGELDTEMGLTLSRPWAEDHFQERVSGYPLNPPPSEAYWPYARAGNAEHKVDEKFHHTYPERIWPKQAGDNRLQDDWPNMGIRYEYGDLMDVVKQLRKNPLTRQAYLPIWFPEDTGARGTERQRVPCTLGYHFICRRGRLDIVYYIRSCDLLRHYTDDVYMAARLCQWMVNALNPHLIQPGDLIMHISSLHIFRGDYEMINYKLNEAYKKGIIDDEQYGAAV